MGKNCTVYRTIDIISKRWSLLILLSIYKSKNNTKRYNEIKKDLSSITSKILSSRLKDLERENIIKREIDDSEIPLKVYYSLNDSGKDLIKIIQDIKKWSLKWKIKNDVCDNTKCKDCNI
jgi:DNA-binding HxlR family transcriptional regulator